MAETARWRDPFGLWHRVLVLRTCGATATIEYWDNRQRGVKFVRGRHYNHATRVTVDVPQAALAYRQPMLKEMR